MTGKLKCGCTPDASGYGYCGECTRALRKKIWSEMSEKRKAYDRHFDPAGSAELDHDVGEGCCSCHLHAPCGYCESKGSEEELDGAD